MRVLLLLFILVPIAELFLLIEVGDRIGALPTIALVLLTAAIGLVILRSQGFATMLRARERLISGELPGHEIVEGFLLAIGGALLLTPGFMTDAVGFLLLLPWSRKALVARLFKSGRMVVWGRSSAFRAGSAQQPGRSDVFEGEFTRESRSRNSLEKPDGDDRQP